MEWIFILFLVAIGPTGLVWLWKAITQWFEQPATEGPQLLSCLCHPPPEVQEELARQRSMQQKHACPRKNPNTLASFVVDTALLGRVYCARVDTRRWYDTVWLVVCITLPDGFSLSRGQWKKVVQRADERWRRTCMDGSSFDKMVRACADEKVANMMASARRSTHDQQQQQQHAQYGAAGAATPNLEELSTPELQNFIRENHLEPSRAHMPRDRSLLLPLAQRALQVWECTRILKCSNLPNASTEQEVAAALCVLQLDFGASTGAAMAAARAASAAQLRRRYQQLARRVHPDKMHGDSKARQQQSEDAFKQLGKAYELLCSYAGQG